MGNFSKIVLFTGDDGRARFREESIALSEGTPQMQLSAPMAATQYLLRRSPVGFRSEPHCAPYPMWVFVLAGEIEVGLLDGTSRFFKAGQHFYSADMLPEGASFDPAVHGHWSRQVGADPLVTLFLRPSNNSEK